MIGKHVVDDSSRRACRKGVGAGEGSEGNERLPQGPTTTSRPGCLIEWKRCPERLPASPGEERPRDRQVAGGIADAGAPEVDDGAQLAVPYQEVSRGNIAVDPDRCAAPRRRQRRVPDLRRGVGNDRAIEGGDRLAGFAVIDGQRTAAKEVVRPGRWSPVGSIR
jgi:hypothetical protein